MAFGLFEAWQTRFPRDRLVENRERVSVREASAAGLRPGRESVIAANRQAYWLCRCGARVVFLYPPNLVCSRCAGLDWSSRHVARQTPELHRIRRWRRQLKIDEAPFSPIPRLPHARHRQHELMAKIWAEEQRLIEHLARINTDLEHRLGWDRAGSGRSRRPRNGQNP